MAPAGDHANEDAPRDDARSTCADSPSPQRFPLRRGGGAILLESEGFRIVQPSGLRRSPLQRYEALTHVVATERLLLIGSQSGLCTVRRSEFKHPAEAPEEVRRALLAARRQRAGGSEALARMASLDRLGRLPGRSWVVWVTVLLCFAGTATQLSDPLVEQVGAFVPELFSRGEFWRGVTAHFLHGIPGFPMHLVLNVLGLLALGVLVERPLGPWRTAILLAMGGVGTIIGSALAGYDEVIGSSGLVAALAGGILSLELHFPEAVPAWWRLPRRLFIGALLVQLVLDQVFANVLAGGAHMGGFTGGYLAAWLLGSSGLEEGRPSGALRLAALAALGAVLVGLVAAVPLARRQGAALEKHALRLLNTPAEYHLIRHENATAWFLATEVDPPTIRGLDLAVALADRAVANTYRSNPNVLDTLAEALFQRGDQIGALLVIDEAIRLAPHQRYFLEQRRRFTGERAADDRPDPPGSGGPWPEDPEEDWVPLDPEAPSVTI